MDIKELELTIRSSNALREAGIETAEHLMQLTWDQIKDIPNLGSKSLSEIAWNCVLLLNGNLAKRERELRESTNPYEERMHHKLTEARKLVKELQEVLKRP